MAEQRRLALINTFYLPDLGGATVVCSHLTRRALRAGWTVRVFCLHSVAPGSGVSLSNPRRYDVEGVEVVSYPTPSDTLVPGSPGFDGNTKILQVIQNDLRRFGPAVVHAHALQGIGAEVLPFARDLGARVIVSLHDWWAVCPAQFCPVRQWDASYECWRHPDDCQAATKSEHEVRRAAIRRLLGAASVVTVPSNFLRKSLLASGLEGVALKVVENGVSFSSSGPAAQREADPGVVTFGYVGGDLDDKGSGILLEAAASLPASTPARVLYFGAAGLGVTGSRRRRWWKQLSPLSTLPVRVVRRLRSIGRRVLTRYRTGRSNGVPVSLYPRFSPEERDAIYSMMDVLVLPSIVCESYSLATHEALARGVPVIATRCGGPEEVVLDGVNGLLVDANDVAGLAEAMVRLTRDPALLRRLTVGARNTSIISAEKACGELLSLYG